MEEPLVHFSTLVGLIHSDLATIKDAFSVEEFFDKRIEDYYDTLMEATQGNLKPFIVFLSGVRKRITYEGS
ncbi:hypothetical protein ACFSQ7_09040 [Paenibacillus rhizoplanae]